MREGMVGLFTGRGRLFTARVRLRAALTTTACAGRAVSPVARTGNASGSVVRAAVLSIDNRAEASEAALGEGVPRLTQCARVETSVGEIAVRPEPKREERSEPPNERAGGSSGGTGVGSRVVEMAGGASRLAKKGKWAGAHMEAER